MDMNRLARLSDRVLSIDEKPLYIRLPARKLISRLLLFLTVGTVLLTMSYTLAAIVSIPVLVYWSYLYVLYCHIWNRYRLSRFWTVGAPIGAFVLSVGLRYILYYL